MSVLFAGTEPEAFDHNGAGVVVNTSTSHFDSTFSRAATAVDGVSYAEAPFAANAEVWLHLVWAYEFGDTPSGVVAEILDSATGRALVRLKLDGSSNIVGQYWDGSAWQGAGSANPLAVTYDVIYTLDLHCKIANSGGTFAWYVSGSLQETIKSGDTLLDTPTTVDRARFHGTNPGNASLAYDAFISEVVVADEPTIAWRLATLYPSGAGTNTAWTGDYTAVDESGIDDGDVISSATAAQVETMAAANTPGAASAHIPQALVVTARARRGSTGPQNLQLAVRSGTTEDFSASKALTTGYAHYREVWSSNPDTAAAWTISELDAVEIGVKSIA